MTYSYSLGSLKLGECFWLGLLDPVSLMVPIWPEERLWSMTKKLLELRATASTAPILRLPIELLHKISEYLDDLPDIAAFCVAHPILGVIGEDRIHEVREKTLIYTYRGHRLIMLGDYADVNDLPEDVRGDLQQDMVAYHGVNPENLSRYDLWSCVTAHPYAQYPHHVIELSTASVIRQEHMFDLRKHDRVALLRIQDLVLPRYLSPDQEDLVLCNLTKGVYVKNGPVRKLGDRVKRFGVKLNLGTVVLAYSCWSSDDSAAMVSSIAEKITRGPWAGDRFEVNPFASMSIDVEWKDVTEEVVTWLKEICVADIGSLDD